ncbi:hypothetical protein NWT09_12405 [Mycolicibacterium sp. jd]|uniref:hypothetical protein n=1 Tax=unclassified Mycolicibacterium TaxID=2636767 RepID=UPI00351BA03B
MTNPAQMNLEWFRRVLGDAGLLADSDLATVELEPVGGGVIARMVRATLTYADPTSAPKSVIDKYPTDDPGSYGLSKAMSLYELETRFYQDVAPLVPDLALAYCHLAKLADNATDFTLVFEDLGPIAAAGDGMKAATPDQLPRARHTRRIPGAGVELDRTERARLAGGSSGALTRSSMRYRPGSNRSSPDSLTTWIPHISNCSRPCCRAQGSGCGIGRRPPWFNTATSAVTTSCSPVIPIRTGR